MPKKLQKTLQDYLSKLKNPHPQIQSSKNWILSGCKHPKTPSFALDGRNTTRENDHHNHHHHAGGSNNNTNTNHNNNNKDDAATLADVDRFLFENFKSLYFKDDDETENNNNNNNKRVDSVSDESEEEEAPPPIPKGGSLSSYLFESPRVRPPPRLDLCGSTRFFVKPGISGSLMEDALSLTNVTNTSDEAGSSNSTTSTTSPNSKDHNHNLPDNCVALLTYSPSPYDDFRRSMQDVVEARYGKINNNEDEKRVMNIDWDFMEELLFCYLNLNEKKSHKFILSAFVDLVTLMRRNSDTTPPAKPRSVRTVKFGREVRKKKTKQVTIEYGSS